MHLATRFVQFHLLKHMVVLVFTEKSRGGGVGPFQARATSLAARLGAGNLAGAALALFVGGPGAIIWMWMTTLVGIMICGGIKSIARVAEKIVPVMAIAYVRIAAYILIVS